MPTVLTWNEACHWTVPPGFRLAVREYGRPAGSRLAPVPWFTYPSISSRVANRDGEVSSWTSSPALVWPVRLVTVPATVTVLPGLAVCGVIESMATETRPAWAGWPVWACAGAARPRTAVTAAGTTATAARARIRRGMPAGSKPCTLGMVWPIETDPCVTLNGRVYEP